MTENLAAGVEAFTSNAFLVAGERTVLVDAGADFDVVARLRDRVDALDAVVLTHTHPDHVGNVEAVRAAFDAPVLGFDPEHALVDRAVADGGELVLGDDAYVALHTPGHATDHLCLYAAGPGVLFTGDLVFAGGSFGRTDLPGADRATLLESIDRVLDVVGPDLGVFHAGHGPSATDEPYAQLELARRFAATA